MFEFNGWEMPVDYPAATGHPGGLLTEHLAVRNSVGVFDVSHMGDIRVHGPQALAAVQQMTLNDAGKLAVGQAQYSALLYPTGTFVDDMIIYRLGDEDFLLAINAGSREKDYHWVRDAAAGFRCEVEDLSDQTTQIAIQGPNAWRVLQKVTGADLSQIKSNWFIHDALSGVPNVLISRTGYTAEDGFELYLPGDELTSTRVWRDLLAAGAEFGIIPCGLGARNTLRLEGAFALYGHEISETITPLEARLERFLNLDKGEFTGRAALLAQKAGGLDRILVGLEAIDRGIPRDGYPVTDLSGKPIGVVTSGSPAPSLKKNIALAYVPPSHSAEGAELAVDVRGQPVKCRVIPTPFYKRPKIANSSRP
jgi:aminomethyltransferase